jgi:hypothetical protein
MKYEVTIGVCPASIRYERIGQDICSLKRVFLFTETKTLGKMGIVNTSTVYEQIVKLLDDKGFYYRRGARYIWVREDDLILISLLLDNIVLDLIPIVV